MTYPLKRVKEKKIYDEYRLSERKNHSDRDCYKCKFKRWIGIVSDEMYIDILIQYAKTPPRKYDSIIDQEGRECTVCKTYKPRSEYTGTIKLPRCRDCNSKRCKSNYITRKSKGLV